MNFPVWSIPWLGSELLRTALFFAFAVAGYFAAGGSLIMVLLEHKAQREGNQALLSFLQNWSRFFLLMTVIVCGSLAVGFVQVSAVTQPAAFTALIRILFWVWGIIWILILIQIAAALLYNSGWGAMAPHHHLAIGWIFVTSAWLTLFMGNGVLSFMQTPGEWLNTGQLRDGFFNASFNPGLLVHAGAALGLAGLFSLVAGSATALPKLRTALVKSASGFVVAGFVLLPLGEGWHAATLPPASRVFLEGFGSLATVYFYGSIVLSLLIAAFVAAGPLNRPESSTRSLALLLLVLGLVVTYAGGWVRHSVRSPYVISDYLYINGLDQRVLGKLNREGFLKHASYVQIGTVAQDPLRAGWELFRQQCLSCHTVNGHRSIRRAVQGWDTETLDQQLQHLDELRGRMPPFAGTAAERRALAKWLESVAAKPSLEPADR